MSYEPLRGVSGTGTSQTKPPTNEDIKSQLAVTCFSLVLAGTEAFVWNNVLFCVAVASVTSVTWFLWAPQCTSLE